MCTPCAAGKVPYTGRFGGRSSVHVRLVRVTGRIWARMSGLGCLCSDDCAASFLRFKRFFPSSLPCLPPLFLCMRYKCKGLQSTSSVIDRGPNPGFVIPFRPHPHQAALPPPCARRVLQASTAARMAQPCALPVPREHFQMPPRVRAAAARPGGSATQPVQVLAPSVRGARILQRPAPRLAWRVRLASRPRLRAAVWHLRVLPVRVASMQAKWAAANASAVLRDITHLRRDRLRVKHASLGHIKKLRAPPPAPRALRASF